MPLLDSLIRTFASLDKDGDGAISTQDLMKVCQQLEVNANEDQVKELIREADTNNDNVLDQYEFLALAKQMLVKIIKSATEMKQLSAITGDEMSGLKTALAKRPVFDGEREIKHVVMIVVVKEEIQPVLDEFDPKQNPDIEGRFLGLVTAHSGIVTDNGNSYKLDILQVANSKVYGRHYSGYTQVSAIMALVAKELKPELVISFGTSGGITGRAMIGDAVLANGCVFIDRLRTSSKSSHDWGVFGGPTIPASKMAKDLKLVEGIIGSQISYLVSDTQVQLIDAVGVYALDMEAAPEAEIAMQVGMNLMAIKMVSNGVYPGNGALMEDEYVKYKHEVSKRGIETLRGVLHYLAGKKLSDLA